MLSQTRSLCVALATSCALSASAQAQVWVVDAAGNGDFTTIQPAIDAASTDELIVVRTGQYPGFDATGRSFDLVADGAVVIADRAVVSEVPLGGAVTLSGLELRAGFAISDSVGRVQFQDCVVPRDPIQQNGTGNPFPDWSLCHAGDSRQEVTGSREVVFVGCSFTGADGRDAGSLDGAPGHHGLSILDATVDLYHCFLHGGDGGDGNPFGHGFTVSGAGGDGLRARGALADVRLTDCELIGGVGGVAIPGLVIGGCDGVPLDAQNGALVQTSAAPVFTAPALVRGGASAPVSFAGLTGSPAWLLRGIQMAREPFHLALGVLFIGRPNRVLPLGSIPGSGVLTFDIAQAGPNGVREFFGRHYQALVLESGQRRLTAPRRTWIVASSF